ncbi:pimeloyl-ACP methyl ester carboxylesterase [Streptosporangium becharense]|uniref:Pimeloyl-ACP methyl ester carboxylesterase n=1 Tax=Streptosporangium becharense TaxID=1816182 RepID=A0A7W9IF57_9ACTN|nr:alpha/beta hydrolase [Streptosporangium becharense]MBB2909859.1 pimeloyl-ACP methyl ester carboxylesterase [Streptosporangium becharense]MBB5819186.1 pimeloyl-ACP methyl ester carboxylesterase [Streptosporangium becharense]
MLPLVLVHGVRVSATMWNPVVPHLGRPTAAVDLPGHGTRKGEPFTMGTAASAVADAIDRLGGRAIVAGLSLGGYVGIAAAERFPDRVAGLVAMGCTTRAPRTGASGPEHGDTRPAPGRSRLRAVRRPSWADGYRIAASLAARNPSFADRLSAYALRRLFPGPVGEAFVAGGLSCEVLPQVVEAVTGHDQLAALAAYPGRVWLVNGSRDPFRANERDFLRACRDGRLILIPRRGHLGVMAAPRPLARLIGDLCVQAEAA